MLATRKSAARQLGKGTRLLSATMAPAADGQWAQGKHVDVRLLVLGQAEGPRLLSRRLFIFDIVGTAAAADSPLELESAPRARYRLMLKDRDGFFTAHSVARIAEHLVWWEGGMVRARAFPEVDLEGALVLHVVELELLEGDGSLRFAPDCAAPRCTPKEPEALQASDEQQLWPRTRARARARNDTRHQRLVAWLCAVYGEDRLRAGTGVLDVAGGAGGTAFELSVRRGIPCTVVDPRPVVCTPKQARGLKHMHDSSVAISGDVREGGIGGANARADREAPAAADAMQPPAGAPACTDGADTADERAGGRACTPPTFRRAVTDLAHARRCVLPRQLQVCFDASFAGAGALRECSLVLGLHADQATEHIVELAIRANKPFAVLPCCVFPSLFPQRRLADGEPVRKYEQFISYLTACARALLSEPRATRLECDAASQGEAPPPAFELRVARIAGFEGRNLVIYTVPVGRVT